MSVQYTQLPLEDESILSMDYSSAFTYDDPSRRYKSIFTYNTGGICSGQDEKIKLQTADARWAVTSQVCACAISLLVYLFCIATFPIAVWFTFKIIPEGQRLVVFRLGRMHQTKGPGLVFLMPFIDKWHKVDIQLKAFNVPPQQVITGNGAIIELGADVYYRISNPELSITHVQNLDKSIRILVQTSLLNLLVRLPLAEIEGHTNDIAEKVQDSSNKSCLDWGIEICRLDISQVKVLQKPISRAINPSLALPPLTPSRSGENLADTSFPEALQNMASAFLAIQGCNIRMKESTQAELDSLLQDSSQNISEDIISGDGTSLSEACWTANNIQEILKVANAVLNESLVRKVGALYQFQLCGEDGRVYFLNLKYGCGSIGEGVWSGEGEVDASIMMTLTDLQLMLCGHLKPFQAYMSGRLQVLGDLEAALRLEMFVDKVFSLNKLKC